MTDEMIDLCDRRGRLIRLAIAIAVGAIVTLAIMSMILSAGVKQNPDAISQMMPFLLGAAVFVVSTVLALAGVKAIARRLRGPTPR
jgi:hypothetical protein